MSRKEIKYVLKTCQKENFGTIFRKWKTQCSLKYQFSSFCSKA